MKIMFFALALLFVGVSASSRAQDFTHWTAIAPGQSYAVKPLEGRPFIILIAVRGESQSEPVNVGFYVQGSSTCKALANPVDGAAYGNIGSIGVVEIDGKDYALDGACDGGNLTLVPSYWVTRQELLHSIQNDATLDVRFKFVPPSFDLHYRTDGFNKVLAALTH